MTQTGQRGAEAARMGYRTVIDASARTLGGAIGEASLHQRGRSDEPAAF